MLTDQEEKDRLDPPPPQQQQHNEGEEDEANTNETETPHHQHKVENERQPTAETPQGHSTAPSILSISSHPSSPSFASPLTSTVLSNPTPTSYASYYNHPPALPHVAPPTSVNNNFNQHNHAMMCTSLKTFPEKLHQILEYAAQNGLDDVIGFFSHGRAFKVHKVCLHL